MYVIGVGSQAIAEKKSECCECDDIDYWRSKSIANVMIKRERRRQKKVPVRRAKRNLTEKGFEWVYSRKTESGRLR